MAFFGNDAINRVNLHYAIQALASGAGGVFFFAYLLHAGVSIPVTLVAFTTIIAGRFALRPLILPLGKRWGLKPLVIAGALLTAAQYPLLAQVHGIGWPLLANLAVACPGSTLYWPTFHAWFAALGNAEHRGHQTSAREAAATVIGIVAPLAGAWALTTVGPLWAFGGVAVAQALSVLPLIGAPNVRPALDAPGAYRAARQGMWIFMLDGWLAATMFYVWQVALFVSVGESLKAFGGALALAALVGAALGILFGRHIDRGHGRRAVAIAYAAAAVLVLAQAASFGSPWLAIAANALAAVAFSLMTPAMMTAVYNLAQASPCPFRFNIVSEGGWDIGCGAGVLTAAAIAALGGPLSLALLLALPAIAGVAWLLWRYYGAHPAAGGVEIAAPLAGEPPLTMATPDS